MASTLSFGEPMAASEPKRRVCFSFAAYAKAVVELLRAAGTPVAPGLSEAELAALESAHGLDFPPDLRAILREGLPVASGFPDWRSASPHHLRLLLTHPLSSLVAEASRGRLWSEAWGDRPANPIDRAAVVKAALAGAPPLVPIYRHFYMPCTQPGVAGNPVFLVSDGEVRLAGLDLVDFLGREELRLGGALPCAAWAAKSARCVEVWTDLAESSSGGPAWSRREVEGFIKEMGWVLREGGWGEEEVREMLAGSDGGDEGSDWGRMVLIDRQSVLWHVRLLALALLRAGWSSDDVLDSMGEAPSAREKERRKPLTWQADPTKNEISMEL